MLIFIPGYKEDNIIVDTAKRALQQEYPSDKYKVVVLADSFSPETLTALSQVNVHVLEVSFENSTKAKSINRGLEFYAESDQDIVVILDSDNVMSPNFLKQVNKAYNSGFKAIQGHRTSKNQDTTFALLDSINEEIGNSFFRKGHRVLGMSSGLIGSAMAFDFSFLKEIMNGIGDVAGEDKLMELKILEQKAPIEFLPNAYVLDEKVSNANTFSKQRTRWVGVQIYFFKHYFLKGFAALFKSGKVDYCDKAFQMSLIPKVLLVGLLSMLSALALLGLLSESWLVLTGVYFTALLLAVPKRFYNLSMIRAIANLPKAIFYMILSILRIRKHTASKFEVTEKNVKI